MYQNNSQTNGKLQTEIAAKIREIPREEYKWVIDNFVQQIRLSPISMLKKSYFRANITFVQSKVDN